MLKYSQKELVGQINSILNKINAALKDTGILAGLSVDNSQFKLEQCKSILNGLLESASSFQQILELDLYN